MNAEKVLPELPDGWIWTTIGGLVNKVQYGYTTSASEVPCGPKLLRITDIQDGAVNWNNVPYCEITLENKDKYLLKPGDIVFARTGATTGKSYLIQECLESVFASYLIRLQTTNIDVKFLYQPKFDTLLR